MTGPEHYQEAERLLAAAQDKAKEVDVYGILLARAQVHATLALAAATARQPYGTNADATEWFEVAGRMGKVDVSD